MKTKYILAFYNSFLEKRIENFGEEDRFIFKCTYSFQMKLLTNLESVLI